MNVTSTYTLSLMIQQTATATSKNLASWSIHSILIAKIKPIYVDFAFTDSPGDIGQQIYSNIDERTKR